MSAIGGIIDSAVNAVVGSSGNGTSRQDFLSHFTSADGIWAKTIDPFTTFDVTMKFFPSVHWPDPSTEKNKKEDKSWASNLGNTLVSSAKGAVKSFANNATGGLLGSFMNSKVDIMKNHDSNADLSGMQTTFMEYLAAANMIVGKEDWIGESAG